MKEREEKKWNEKNLKEKKAFYQLSSVKKNTTTRKYQ